MQTFITIMIALSSFTAGALAVTYLAVHYIVSRKFSEQITKALKQHEADDPLAEHVAKSFQDIITSRIAQSEGRTQELINASIRQLKYHGRDIPSPPEINALVYNHTRGLQNHVEVLERRIEQLEANNLRLSQRLDEWTEIATKARLLIEASRLPA